MHVAVHPVALDPGVKPANSTGALSRKDELVRPWFNTLSGRRSGRPVTNLTITAY